ncbi:YhcN/YlaJ family sporulation lipoprotein [Peribacillus castrilensis]|uniref:YhcN/YlaJ family sporulation lipoprotein n=1 Tax=Peribacillus TaxID=2675229 RepID=UPI00137A182C|nr:MULTISPECIES: YhcN/YlaJ family sporulation lipoprotein [Peribacillus]MCD1163216.1 YhcN/YlaJ family sporulation lipoprotein [Peribacillus castrilensis]MBD8589528.1 YhcN/YlaJ family sporulation lipoprotein [Peribacillus simplex]MCP1154246.1 YhcN/YlaJ family sporulation lipoprotein [Peribacillus frigoritolerans]MDM5313132.1 YhcN/YlaJ family sporulation lipoprotein [Peribacillus frigoritolerans]MEA3573987.1 YhcN/YlaJ family sporulation lipoprotein [Peribacillus frigoritolerans]
MQKIKWAQPLCTVLAAVSLVGCANNDTAENENITNDTGYHEKDALVRNINYENMVQGLYNKDDAYSKSDRNYHGHESKPLKAKSSYYNSYEGSLADRVNGVANKVEQVSDARTIIMQDEMLVALLLDDYSQAKDVKQRIKKEIGPLTNGRTLYVTTDEGVYFRTMTLDNNLRDGDTREMIILDANDMFDNLNIHENHLK